MVPGVGGRNQAGEQGYCAGEVLDGAAEQARLNQIAPTYPSVESDTEGSANVFAAQQAMVHVVGPDVLVLGAATCAWASALLERFDGFDSVDAVASLIERQQREYGTQIRGFVSLFEEFSPERHYDTVVLGHVLEHVQNPVALLRRARGWCRPQGRLLILVPNADSVHRLVGVELGALAAPDEFSPGDVKLGHRRVYTQETLQRDVELAGLSCETMEGSILKPLSNAQMDAWDNELRQAFFALGRRLPHVACVLICVAR